MTHHHPRRDGLCDHHKVPWPQVHPPHHFAKTVYQDVRGRAGEVEAERIATRTAKDVVSEQDVCPYRERQEAEDHHPITEGSRLTWSQRGFSEGVIGRMTSRGGFGHAEVLRDGPLVHLGLRGHGHYNYRCQLDGKSIGEVSVGEQEVGGAFFPAGTPDFLLFSFTSIKRPPTSTRYASTARFLTSLSNLS